MILKAALLACVSAVSNAYAVVTYAYTSPELINVWDYSRPKTSPLYISISFSDDGDKLLNWSVSHDSIGSVSSNDFSYLLFAFQTDANGQITSWYFDAGLYNFYIAEKTYSRFFFSYSGLSGNKTFGYGPINPDESADYAYQSTSPLPDESSVIWNMQGDVYGLPSGTGIWSYDMSFKSMDFAGNKTGTLHSASDGLVPSASPVPEPETYALMLVGLAVVGAAAKRRKAH